MRLAQIAFGLAAVAIVGCGGKSSSDPAPTDPGGPRSISFWTPNRGLAVAGRCEHGRCSGTVSLTTDGGHSFHRVFATEKPVAWVDTADDLDAWAMTEGHGASQLLHTGDGGRNWQTVAADSPAMAPSFTTARQGLSLDTRGRSLLRTSDGGRTWTRSRAPCNGPATEAAGVAATRSRSLALCVGQPGVGNQGKEIWSSSDLGGSWARLISVGLPGQSHIRDGGISSYGYPQGLSLSSAGTGVMWEGRGTTYLTHNAGQTWRPLSSITRPEANFGQSSSTVDATTAFLLQTAGLPHPPAMELLVTHDGGSTWARVHGWNKPPGY